jgi:nitroreductase
VYFDKLKLHYPTPMKTTRRDWVRAAGVAGAVSVVPAKAGTPKAEPSAAALLEVFAKRQSVRKYKSDPVPDEHVRMILDAARRAPTCMNEQPWKFLVVRKKETIERMRKQTVEMITKVVDGRLAQQLNVSQKDLDNRNEAIARTEGYFTAPVYVVVLVDKECQCGVEYMKQDGTLAAGYLMLAARALGYGTVYLTDGVPEQVSREVLNIPPRYQRICMTPVGVPDPWPPMKAKKKLEELIAYEQIT